MPNTGTRHEHAGTAGIARLTGSMTSGSSSFTVDNGTGFPTGAVGPFYIVIGRSTANEEMVLCSARSGNTFTVAASGRGVSGTVALSHSATETVEHALASDEVDAFDNHAASTSGLHGVAGAVVGTTDAQTLTNKTISGASNTLSSIAQASITGLSTSLAGKSDTSHLHTGVYANPTHTHAESDVTSLVSDLAAKQSTSAKDAANGYAGLDASAKIKSGALNTVAHVRAYTTTNQGLSVSGTWVRPSFAGEDFNTVGTALHSTSSNSHLFTIQTTGYYRIHAQIQFENVSSAGGRRVQIRKNATASDGSDGTQLVVSGFQAPAGTGQDSQFSASTTEYLTAGDTVSVFGWQNSGGGMNMVSGRAGTFVTIDQLPTYGL